MHKETGTFVFYHPHPKRPAVTTRLKQLDHFSRQIEHKLYQCSVYCWLAEGFTRTKENSLRTCYFIYMEYRDSTGASRYQAEQFFSLNEALNWLDTRAQTAPLLEICVQSTQKDPVNTQARKENQNLSLAPQAEVA